MGQFKTVDERSGELVAEAQIRFQSHGDHAELRRQIVHARISAVLERLVVVDRRAVVDALDFWLEDLSAGMPHAPQYGDISRENAVYWADTATPVEIEVYVAAGLASIRRKLFAMGLLKRMMVNIWARLGPEDQRAFLARVDPNGAFRGRAA